MVSSGSGSSPRYIGGPTSYLPLTYSRTRSSESGSSLLPDFAVEEDEDATYGLATHIKGKLWGKGLLFVRALS